MRVTILGSGSEGNALLLESDLGSVLVDAGLSFRKLTQRFAALGRSMPADIRAVIVTHSHGDHAAHASTYATRLGCPVKAAEQTLNAIRLRPAARSEAFTIGKPFVVAGIEIWSQSVPHDAPQVALRFETEQTSVGLVTDLGRVPRELGSFVSGCETLLLESNHDPEMLAGGPYPTVLKRRVGGARGHLSNGQAGDLLAALDAAPRRVVLMHLSETNNSPALARSSAEAALGHRGTELLVAHQRNPLALDPGRAMQMQLRL